MASSGGRAVLRRRCQNLFRGVRQQRQRDAEGSLVDLIRGAAADNNSAVVPTRATMPGAPETPQQAVFREALEGLRAHPPSLDTLLVPTHAHSVSWTGRGCEGHAWLPEDFVTDCNAAIAKELRVAKPERLMMFMALVDRSFSPEANNHTLARLGEALLHAMARTWCLDIEHKVGPAHQLAALEMLADRNLSRVFRGYHLSKHVLTDLATAKTLDGHCFYGAHIGRDVVQFLNTDEGARGAPAETPTEAAKTDAKIRVYSECLKALVGNVYLEFGMDTAVEFVDAHVAPRLRTVIETSAETPATSAGQGKAA